VVNLVCIEGVSRILGGSLYGLRGLAGALVGRAGLCWIGWLGVLLLDMEYWEKMLMSSSSWLLVEVDD